MSIVDSSKYVVLDVETNGLSSVRDDLLSISIYKPDTGEVYTRFLPLELQSKVLTTGINGIKTSDLKGLKPLNQDEVDELIRVFELKERTILTYGGIDEKFMIKYFQRHHLEGIDYFAFYNFKHEIISSRFSEGNITKDNLCNMYGIENVQNVHTGSNDCVLEWKLFEKMNGNRLLITDNKVFEFNDRYVVPVSYITTYPNLKYYLPPMPKIHCESKVIFSLPVSASKFKKFPTNFNGMILEHLINSVLHVQEIDSRELLLENKSRLHYLGKLPSEIDIVPLMFNPDGSMTATRPQDKNWEEDINAVIKAMKKVFKPMFTFIADDIFQGQTISSQELMYYPEKKVLALCDLSSSSAILEIKSQTYGTAQTYAEQLYYESNGRKCYLLLTDWANYPKELIYTINEVTFSIEEPVDPKEARYKKAKERIETDIISLVEFVNAKMPVRLKCNVCGNEWNTSYNLAAKHRPCPVCSPKVAITKEKRIRAKSRPVISETEMKAQKLDKYRGKLDEKSNHSLEALEFTGSRFPAKVKCRSCGHIWSCRADHLLERPYCSKCKQK